MKWLSDQLVIAFGLLDKTITLRKKHWWLKLLHNRIWINVVTMLIHDLKSGLSFDNISLPDDIPMSGVILILKEGKGLQILVIYWTPFQVKVSLSKRLKDAV